jgi:carbamoyl-phosphate synthase large subunit
MNVLLSSVGRRSYLVHFFREALHNGGKVVCTNCYADTPGMFFADEARVVPASYEPGFLDAMLDVCREFRPKLLFSLHDVEVPCIARWRDRFLEVGTFPVVAEREFAEMCLDKFESFCFLREQGVPSARTYLRVEEAVAAVKCGEIGWPVVVKPRFGFGSFGLSFASDEQDLIGQYSSLTKEVRRHAYLQQLCQTGDLVIVQEMLAGVEYGLDIICDLEGRFRTCLIEQKYRMRAGETDAAEIIEDPRLFDLGSRIAETTRVPGVLDLDVIVRDGTPHVLEMNPRFGGHYPFAHVAGANVPAALIAWAEGREADPAWLQARVGAKAFKDIALVSC